MFANHIPAYQIEKEVDNPERGVGIRRMVLAKIANLDKPLSQLPYRNYDYNYVSLFAALDFLCILFFVAVITNDTLSSPFR